MTALLVGVLASFIIVDPLVAFPIVSEPAHAILIMKQQACPEAFLQHNQTRKQVQTCFSFI